MPWLGSQVHGQRGPFNLWKDVKMFLLNSLNLLLDGRRGDDAWSSSGSNGKTEFPEGQLTSAAWEGWWHEEAA